MSGTVLILILLSSTAGIDTGQCSEMLAHLRGQEMRAFNDYKEHNRFAHNQVREYHHCLNSCNGNGSACNSALSQAQVADRQSGNKLLKLLNVSSLWQQLKHRCNPK
jgi:hypothetical protein